MDTTLTADSDGKVLAHHGECHHIRDAVALGHRVGVVPFYDIHRSLPPFVQRCSCLETPTLEQAQSVPPPSSQPLVLGVSILTTPSPLGE